MLANLFQCGIYFSVYAGICFLFKRFFKSLASAGRSHSSKRPGRMCADQWFWLAFKRLSQVRDRLGVGLIAQRYSNVAQVTAAFGA